MNENILQLYPHQQQCVDYLRKFDNCLIGDDMGLGKTFEGSEMLKYYNNKVNLIVCQKSKIEDWKDHIKKYYDYIVCDLTLEKSMINRFLDLSKTEKIIGIINYDLIFRREDLLKLENFTLLLDESSEIKNEHSKRGRFMLKMKPKNVILLTGTPMNGKFEELWSQLKLLRWNISRNLFDNQYLEYKIDMTSGYPRKVIIGYKNKERLLKKLKEHGGVFRKTEEVFELPNIIEQNIFVKHSKEYVRYMKKKVIQIEEKTLIGDTQLVDRLNQRFLCGAYSKEKLQAYEDLINSTNDRIIVFYNFKEELVRMKGVTHKPMSYVNGDIKDLKKYNDCDDSITFVQYQAGSMGLNLQKANKVIYFSPPDGNSIYFEQSQKRTHRIGQERTCFYYYLIVENSVEDEIYETLGIRKKINNELFRKEEF